MCFVLCFSLRIIPAHAGQTSSRNSYGHHYSDHPRACGANQGVVKDVFVLDGSSPRMRGKRTAFHETVDKFRIIPAHAGQTGTARPRTRWPTDHPRACGANVSTAIDTLSRSGSSPRMRGKRRRRQGRRPRIRIIPAHAGQTRHSPEACRSETDHPRACGANSVAGKLKSFVFGSSPRMRGKPRALAWQCHWIRIIPAHAGQTVLLAFFIVVSADHPRACGANGRQ